VTTYGTTRGSDFLIRMLTTPSASPQIGAAKTAASHNPLIRFQVTYKEKDLGEFTLHIPARTTC